jgi:hypothetical protein
MISQLFSGLTGKQEVGLKDSVDFWRIIGREWEDSLYCAIPNVSNVQRTGHLKTDIAAFFFAIELMIGFPKQSARANLIL